MTRICLIPKVTGVGGMVSFQANMKAGLERRGIQTCNDLKDAPYDAVLITAGTRDLAGLGRVRRCGVRIVQRLDGINWLHHRRKGNIRYFLRSEYGNFILALIRRQIATHIVYQSSFVRGWWEDWFGPTRRPHVVIYNGVDLNTYTPDGPHERPADRSRLLVVEGSLATGLDLAVELAGRLASEHHLQLELQVVGKIDPEKQVYWESRSSVPLTCLGMAPRGVIPQIDRSAHLLFSMDINSACPNAVIESLACGLPVAAFDTGALKELVTGDSGRIVPYGSDPWKLGPPDLISLAGAAAGILSDQPRFRAAARARAEEAFGLDRMVEAYLHVLLG